MDAFHHWPTSHNCLIIPNLLLLLRRLPNRNRYNPAGNGNLHSWPRCLSPILLITPHNKNLTVIDAVQKCIMVFFSQGPKKFLYNYVVTLFIYYLGASVKWVSRLKLENFAKDVKSRHSQDLLRTKTARSSYVVGLSVLPEVRADRQSQPSDAVRIQVCGLWLRRQCRSRRRLEHSQGRTCPLRLHCGPWTTLRLCGHGPHCGPPGP
jgi:hypothetical protein